MTPKEIAPLPSLPAAVPPPPVFASSPTGGKPNKKSVTPSFLTDAMSAPSGTGKTLVGQ
jgi:hypothetical protein